MTPVYQTRFGGADAPPEDQGDCLRAAIASLLDLALEAVPDLGPETWYVELCAWLKERRQDVLYVEVRHEAAKDCPSCVPMVYVMPGTFYVAGGLTSRGTPHAVVYRDEQLVHDPIPGGPGLASVDSFLFIFPTQA